VGTVCAAFTGVFDFLNQYAYAFRDIWDYRWLYQILMITTILTGIAGGWATMALIRGGKRVYLQALIILIIGTVLGAIQMFTSLALRGKAIPANMKFYANVITLVLFLVLKLPGIRERVDFSRSGDKTNMTAAGGLAAIVGGMTLLTTFFWAGPSHTYEGANWVNVLQPHLVIGGIVLTLGGLAALTAAASGAVREHLRESEHTLSRS
jgi:hypothetical protein